MRRTALATLTLAMTAALLAPQAAHAIPAAPKVAVTIDGGAAGGTAPAYNKDAPDNSSVLFEFSGAKGQIVGIEAHGAAYIAAIKVWQAATDKQVAISSGSKTTVLYLHFVLPGAGTYYASVVNASTTTTDNAVTCQLRSPVTSPLLLDGSAVTSSVVPSQSAVYTFSGTAGQIVGLYTVKQAAGLDTGGMQLSLVQDSTGNTLATDRAAKDETETGLAATLPAAGTYRLVVSPYPANDSFTGTVSSKLVSPVMGSLQVDRGAVYNTITPSQSLVLTFTGQRHQVVGLFINKQEVIRDGDLDVSVIQTTTGADIASDLVLHNDSETALALDLPGNSTYNIVITPKNSHGYIHNGSISAELKSPVPLDISAAEVPTNADLTPGQSAVFTFSGKKSQLLGMVFGKSGFEKDADFRIRITDQKTGLDLATDTMLKNDVESSFGLVLPTTGTYVAVASPRNPGVFTGRITATLKAPALVALRRGAAAKTVLAIGQGAQFGFSARAGQRLTLSIAKITLVREAALRVLVTNAKTGAMVSSGMIQINAGALKLKVQPRTTGRYQVVLIPASPVATYSGGVTVSLR